jgi:hypothetical protein
VSALPPVDQSLLPADVRSASKDVQQRYATGLAFERQLVSVLAKQLTDTTGDDMTSSPYASLLPDALADSVESAGGLGLARQLAGLDDGTAA